MVGLAAPWNPPDGGKGSSWNVESFITKRNCPTGLKPPAEEGEVGGSCRVRSTGL